MIAEAVRRSPMAGYAERFATLHQVSRGAVSIRELPFLTLFNLLADSNDKTAMERLSVSLGCSLPVAPNTVMARGDRRVLWLGPDEWLVVDAPGQARSVAQALDGGLAGALGSVVDVSASRTTLEIRGARAGDLLAHGVPIDLESRAFAVGRCAQTLLGEVQVIVERRDPGSGFHLYARSSFSAFVGDWLLDAAVGLE